MTPGFIRPPLTLALLLALSACDRKAAHDDPPPATLAPPKAELTKARSPGTEATEPSAHPAAAPTSGSGATGHSSDPAEPHAPSDKKADGLSGASMLLGDKSKYKDDGGTASEPAAPQGTIFEDNTAPVWIERSLDPAQAASSLMAHFADQIDPKKPVLLTPNVGGITWFSNGADDHLRGRITDPRFVRGVIEYLRGRGVTEITLAVSWATGKKSAMEEMLRRSGYKELADAYPEVTLVDLFDYGADDPGHAAAEEVVVATPHALQLEGKLTLPAIYLKHLKQGLVINLPKFKIHRFAVLTAGMKNLMGVLGIKDGGTSRFTKWKMHSELGPLLKETKNVNEWSPEQLRAYAKSGELFARRLADVYEVARPHLTLIDGILASDGDGFDSLGSVPLGVAIGSRNTVYADVIAAQVAGYFHSTELKKQTGMFAPLGVDEALYRFYGWPVAAGGADGAWAKIQVLGDRSLLKSKGRLSLESMNQRKLDGSYREQLAGTSIQAAQVETLASFAQLEQQFPLSESRFITRDFAGKRLPPMMSTAVFSQRTKDTLLFAMRAEIAHQDLRPHPDGPVRGQDVQKLYNWDNFEIFIDPTPATPREYFEIEVSPEGELLDIHIKNGPGRADVAWSSGASIETKVSEGVWLARIVVPLAALGDTTGSPWKANFYRTERWGKDRVYSAWQPTMSAVPNFHVPAAFGAFRF